ncbi:MAG TPA: T9SS type A sorting domain-containing protein, partial [Aquaticitalea sp.]|nr:T9SS type A sorting domain-containing protein [Aquaticitalea sp.]
MTIVGNNAFAYVRDNIIENNDTQGQPNLGGSGISLNTTSPPMEIIASGNAFRGNLWGITVIGQASINLGDGIENMGENVFANNGNGGSVYALYNNTPNTILALNNCWDENNLPNTLEIAEDVIVHQNDISTLGEVLFDPVNCSFLGVEEVALGEFRLYPNPSDGNLSFDNQMRFDTLRIFDLMGRLVLTPQIGPGKNHLMLNLNNGVYFAEFSNTSSKLTKKIIIE